MLKEVSSSCRTVANQLPMKEIKSADPSVFFSIPLNFKLFSCCAVARLNVSLLNLGCHVDVPAILLVKLPFLLFGAVLLSKVWIFVN